MRFSFLFLPLLVLAGCATAPQIVVEPAVPVRVVSFALSLTVRDGGANGPPEMVSSSDAWMGTNYFEQPLIESIEALWKAFAEEFVSIAGERTLLPPGPEESHPGYVEAGFEPLGRYSFAFPPPRARGFLWPHGFRFVDSEPERIRTLSGDYPGEVFLVVEHQAFVEAAADATAFGPAGFRMGLRTQLWIYDASGRLLSHHNLLGFSKASAPRQGTRPDRSKYALLLVDAQRDVLAQWAKKATFRKGT